MEDVKIYGLCLGRLKHQVKLAQIRNAESAMQQEKILLESFCTYDIDDLIEILDLYDIEDRTRGGLMNKLDDLAQTASALMRETFIFDMTDEGHLGIFWVTSARISSGLVEAA